jgi:CubicO group peptidase (beta-lactamase class C family)
MQVGGSIGFAVAGLQSLDPREIMKIIFSVFFIACSILGSTIFDSQLTYHSSEQALVERIDNYMRSGVETGYAGTLLVARDGRIILNKGYGLADQEAGIPNTPETIFDIGSNTKQFTAVAIMKLVDQGKLLTTDRLGELLDDVPADKRDITVHQLLTHSSGLDAGFGGDFDGTTKEEFLAKAFASELISEQGEYRYSNAGYSLLAAIIEEVSGSDYESYLRQNILMPIGLKHTGYLLPDWGQQSLARQYWHGAISRGTTVERYLEDGDVSWNLVGNGGLASTSGDLFQWLEALRTGKVLSDSSQDQIFAQHVKISEEAERYYGYGWGVQIGQCGKTLVRHNGSNGIYYSSIIWHPEDDLTIIYASNTSTSAWPVQEVQRMIFDPHYVPRSFTITPHRMVYEYVVSRSSDGVNGLPEFFERETGEPVKDQSILNQVGIAFEEGGQHETAIALFKLNIHLFPGRGDLWESLGEGYLAAGDKTQALMSYQKSLDLAPSEGCFWCANARQQIAKLQAE